MIHLNSVSSFQLTSMKNKGNYKVAKCSQLEGRARLAVVLLVTLSSLLVALAVSMQSVYANSINENSIHGPDHNNGQQHGRQHGQQQQLGRMQSGLGQTTQPQAQNGQANQNRCQSGWIWFNNKCWMSMQSRRDFVHAIELCKKMYNSTLPTIHSEDENEFLRQNIDLQHSPIWLYARHNHQYGKTRWLDKSPVNYTHWDAGQPSDKSSLVCIKTDDSWYMKKAEPVDGQTECVSFWEDAKWGTQVGCLVLLPVVCERKLTPISRYGDGPNGSISQFEQQQMYTVSAANSIKPGNQLAPLVSMLSVIIVSSFTLTYSMLQDRAIS